MSHVFNDPVRQHVFGNELTVDDASQGGAAFWATWAGVSGAAMLSVFYHERILFYGHFYFELLMSLCD